MTALEKVIDHVVKSGIYSIHTVGYTNYRNSEIVRANGGCATANMAEFTRIYTIFDRGNYTLIDTDLATRGEIGYLLAEIVNKFEEYNIGEDSNHSLLQFLSGLHDEIQCVFNRKANRISKISTPVTNLI